MKITDLKQQDLEVVLSKVCFSIEEIKKINEDLVYFDEAYLTESGNIVVGFQQEFVHDPYMDLRPIQTVRLITYPEVVCIAELDEIFNLCNIPIITRANDKNIDAICDLGFRHIKNIEGENSVLIPIEIPISTFDIVGIDENVRQMKECDLDQIEELLRREYSLRYRMVRMMFAECPEACFLYEDQDEILGLTFNRINDDFLYMRQIFVRSDNRKGGVGKNLYKKRLQFAKEAGLVYAKAHIREESWQFHAKYGAVIKENIEYYIMRV